MVLENVNDFISSRRLSLLVLSNCFVLKIIQKYVLSKGRFSLFHHFIDMRTDVNESICC